MLSASPSPAEIGAQFLSEFPTASPPGQTMGQPPDHVNEKMGPADAANARDFKRAPPAGTTLNSSSAPRTSTSNPRLSDESGNSSSSFAFPVLVSDGGVKTNSLKGVVMDNPDKKPQLQAQVSKATNKAPMRRRWCWFCCWPRCC
ncbi:hypothetical protein DH2020_037092 [Rehmannia glutinosa]|uniref:Uncharacterized protein n=1 Tax=Rehmannia glutinosa TaxID=99300 RepID=A0ABR0V549_REHGL